MSLNEWMIKRVPLFIGVGLVILLGTFLGPLGVVVVIAGIGAIIYTLLKDFKE